MYKIKVLTLLFLLITIVNNANIYSFALKESIEIYYEIIPIEDNLIVENHSLVFNFHYSHFSINNPKAHITSYYQVKSTEDIDSFLISFLTFNKFNDFKAMNIDFKVNDQTLDYEIYFSNQFFNNNYFYDFNKEEFLRFINANVERNDIKLGYLYTLNNVNGEKTFHFPFNNQNKVLINSDYEARLILSDTLTFNLDDSEYSFLSTEDIEITTALSYIKTEVTFIEYANYLKTNNPRYENIAPQTIVNELYEAINEEQKIIDINKLSIFIESKSIVLLFDIGSFHNNEVKTINISYIMEPIKTRYQQKRVIHDFSIVSSPTSLWSRFNTSTIQIITNPKMRYLENCNINIKMIDDNIYEHKRSIHNILSFSLSTTPLPKKVNFIMVLTAFLVPIIIAISFPISYNIRKQIKPKCFR